MNDIASASGSGLLVGGDLLRAVEVAFNRDDSQIGPLSRILVSKAITVVGQSISWGIAQLLRTRQRSLRRGWSGRSKRRR